eukprot:TRINITY_DN3621_c0_g2_i1.p1 TRINITY_DN3621_c0_g2~~TRINITY_DN3621_c0_g2_i1.p1  ORF type:complete len:234 (-),score=50.30 TRINITY_DN3621_c0_g2_i1:71-772(-)
METEDGPASAHKKCSIKTRLFLVLLVVCWALNVAAVAGAVWSLGNFTSYDTASHAVIAKLIINWKLNLYQQCLSNYSGGVVTSTSCTDINYGDSNSQFQGCELRGKIGSLALLITIVSQVCGLIHYIMYKFVQSCVDKEKLLKFSLTWTLFWSVFGPVIALISYSTSDCYGTVNVNLAALGATTSGNGSFTAVIAAGMYCVIVSPIFAACVSLDLIIENGMKGPKEEKPKWVT